jgi:hypothetical protein
MPIERWEAEAEHITSALGAGTSPGQSLESLDWPTSRLVDQQMEVVSESLPSKHHVRHLLTRHGDFCVQVNSNPTKLPIRGSAVHNANSSLTASHKHRSH